MSYKKSDLGASIVSTLNGPTKVLVHQGGYRWQVTQETENGNLVRSYENIPQKRPAPAIAKQAYPMSATA